MVLAQFSKNGGQYFDISRKRVNHQINLSISGAIQNIDLTK